MSLNKRFTKTYSIPIILVPILASSIFVLSASAAGSNTVYYGCVNKKSGTIKMVNAQTKCQKTEMKISWNQVGPKGAKGVTGLQGPKGAKGDTAHKVRK